MAKKSTGEGRGLPRYFARVCTGGWLICDHTKREPMWHFGCPYEGQQQGRRLHEDPIPDRETAAIIASGLNDGTIQPEELSET